jgi:hypothetical protein
MDKTWIMNTFLNTYYGWRIRNKDEIHSFEKMWMMMDESSSMDKNEHTWMTRIDWTIQFLLLITKF